MIYKDIDQSKLIAIPNPAKRKYQIYLEATEVTFLGVKDQPDFANIKIHYVPGTTIIELKSLKQYFYQYRNITISYERMIDVLYEHLMYKYAPLSLNIEMQCTPRGGISSKLTINSEG